MTQFGQNCKIEVVASVLDVNFTIAFLLTNGISINSTSLKIIAGEEGRFSSGSKKHVSGEYFQMRAILEDSLNSHKKMYYQTQRLIFLTPPLPKYLDLLLRLWSIIPEFWRICGYPHDPPYPRHQCEEKRQPVKIFPSTNNKPFCWW